mmetsp:Transcript_116874/g.308797  ORF Transcript_116874/g.308797 Transcript_116874/m.308797 type:complete len:235 (+) Transcript_116874:385-1089(+)
MCEAASRPGADYYSRLHDHWRLERAVVDDSPPGVARVPHHRHRRRAQADTATVRQGRKLCPGDEEAERRADRWHADGALLRWHRRRAETPPGVPPPPRVRVGREAHRPELWTGGLSGSLRRRGAEACTAACPRCSARPVQANGYGQNGDEHRQQFWRIFSRSRCRRRGGRSPAETARCGPQSGRRRIWTASAVGHFAKLFRTHFGRASGCSQGLSTEICGGLVEGLGKLCLSKN